MAIGADLVFEVAVPDGGTVRGSVRGQGSRLDVEVDDPAPFLAGGGEETSKALAQTMARYGVAVRVLSRGIHLATLGDVSVPWWQRLATGSDRIRIGSLRGAGVAWRARRSSRPAALPDLATVRSMAPPTTPFPIFPTMARPGPPPPVSTTHDPQRGGSPRLAVVTAPPRTTAPARTFALERDVTVLGSDEACDIVLPGLRPHHGEIHHDEDDEFVLLPAGPDSSVNGMTGQRLLLRTGSRVQLGGWTLAYVRDEYADHGRPYGGRQGGELGIQRRQPARAPSDPPPPTDEPPTA